MWAEPVFKDINVLFYSPPLGKMMNICAHFDEGKKKSMNPALLDCEKHVAKVYRTEES